MILDEELSSIFDLSICMGVVRFITTKLRIIS
jgi:hypothetical protein